MSSKNSLGIKLIRLTFDMSRDVDGAARDVEAAINAFAQLPASKSSANQSIARSFAQAPVLVLNLLRDGDTGVLCDTASSIIQQKVSDQRCGTSNHSRRISACCTN